MDHIELDDLREQLSSARGEEAEALRRAVRLKEIGSSAEQREAMADAFRCHSLVNTLQRRLSEVQRQRDE